MLETTLLVQQHTTHRRQNALKHLYVYYPFLYFEKGFYFKNRQSKMQNKCSKVVFAILSNSVSFIVSLFHHHTISSYRPSVNKPSSSFFSIKMNKEPKASLYWYYTVNKKAFSRIIQPVNSKSKPRFFHSHSMYSHARILIRFIIIKNCFGEETVEIETPCISSLTLHTANYHHSLWNSKQNQQTVLTKTKTYIKKFQTYKNHLHNNYNHS